MKMITDPWIRSDRNHNQTYKNQLKLFSFVIISSSYHMAVSCYWNAICLVCLVY